MTSLSSPPWHSSPSPAARPRQLRPQRHAGGRSLNQLHPLAPDQVDPLGYSNPFTRFFGENLIRPALGDAYLISTTNEQMLSDGLDNLGTFVVAMGDTISFGGTKWIRQNLYSIDTVNYNSGAYTAGEVAGAAVMTVISIAGSGGTCILGGLGPGFSTIARVYASAGTWIGAGQAAANVVNNGKLTFSDALALSPALGKGIQALAKFGCFVIDTPVAVGWNAEPIYVGQVSQPASTDDENTISIAWLLTGLGLVVTTVYVRDKLESEERKKKPLRRLIFANGKFHSEDFDDPRTFPPLARGGRGSRLGRSPMSKPRTICKLNPTQGGARGGRMNRNYRPRSKFRTPCYWTQAGAKVAGTLRVPSASSHYLPLSPRVYKPGRSVTVVRRHG